MKLAVLLVVVIVYVAACSAYPHPLSEVAGKKDTAVPVISGQTPKEVIVHGETGLQTAGDADAARDARFFWPVWTVPSYGYGWGGYPYGRGYYWG